MKRVMEGLYALVTRYTRWILLLLAVLTGFCVYGVWHLSYSNAITDLLPAHNDEVAHYLHVVKDFGISEDIVLAVEQSQGNVQDSQLFMDIFLEELQADPRFEKLLHDVDYNLAQKLDLIFTPFFLEHTSLLIPPEMLDEFVSRFEPDKIRETIQNNRKMLETGTGSTMLIERDPLMLLGLLSSLSNQMKGKYELDFPDGYYASTDGQLLLAFLKPVDSADNIEYTRELMQYVIETRDRSLEIFKDEAEAPDELTARFTGAHAITYYDQAVMRNDMGSTFLLSFAMVILIFVLAYRNPFSFVYAAVPLLLGELWAFGLAYYVVGNLNLLTSVTAAIIVGLGIDFAIHIYSRYLDERVIHADTHVALKIAMMETGASTLAGGLTTAAAFAAMCFSSFKGLREFGIIASLGILCTLLAVTTVLPLMFLARKRMKRPKRLTRFGLHFFHAVIDRHYRAIFWIFTAITLVMLGFAVQLEISTDMRQLRSQTNPALRLQTRITDKLKASFRSLSVILYGDSQEIMDQRYHRFVRELAGSDVARVESVYSIIPPVAEQQANMDRLRRMEVPENPESVFVTAFDDAGMICDRPCELYIASLVKSLNVDAPLRLKEVLASPMAPLFNRMVKETGDGLELVVHVYPSIPTWDKAGMERLVSRLQDILAEPEMQDRLNYITGIELVVDEIKRLIKENFYLSTLLSLLSVFFLVYLHQGSLRLTALTFFPLVSGIIWMLGMLKVRGDNITLYNFMATPMIIGIGIDQGIHLLDRYRCNDQGDIAEAVIHTGKAITFTAVTTIVGFGSLFISHFAGFTSLGRTTILGVLFCWVCSLFYFPSFLKLMGPGLVNGELSGDDDIC